VVSEAASLMVDVELWTRFFLHDRLYNVDCVLGGWRSHGENRILKNPGLYRKEMNQFIEMVAHQCDQKIMRNTAKLRLIWKFANSPAIKSFLGVSNINKLAANFVAKKLFLDAAHSVIAWDFGKDKWIEATRPFRLP
jgi:hypothetical protein